MLMKLLFRCQLAFADWPQHLFRCVWPILPSCPSHATSVPVIFWPSKVVVPSLECITPCADANQAFCYCYSAWQVFLLPLLMSLLLLVILSLSMIGAITNHHGRRGYTPQTLCLTPHIHFAQLSCLGWLCPSMYACEYEWTLTCIPVNISKC